MARNKIYPRKKRYAKAMRSNLPVPTWVTIKMKKSYITPENKIGTHTIKGK